MEVSYRLKTRAVEQLHTMFRRDFPKTVRSSYVNMNPPPPSSLAAVPLLSLLKRFDNFDLKGYLQHFCSVQIGSVTFPSMSDIQ